MELTPAGAAIENLYPALLQCFAVILCGYAAGRMNLISETEGKGMSTFVGTFSLPALIFMSLAELELNTVNWLFLLSILVAKSMVFFTVIIVAMLVGRPLNLGRAGIFAIFCTQSNDFAIGYPIVAALYKLTHPEYASYLYLVAPINLAVLNPIAFVLMEVHKKRRLAEDEEMLLNQEVAPPESTTVLHKSRCKLVVSIMKNIFLNPIIFMTIFGIIGNLAFGHRVPLYLSGILTVLGSAFSASSLFLLGLRMVGKIHNLTGATLVVPGILIMVKLIVLPVVTREIVNVLHAGSNGSETLDLSTYGFFYGTFPTAPGVFVFATQYLIDVDLIASAMVACTFLSAPLMFVSAKMITITNCDPSQYVKELGQLTLDVSIVGVLACVWVVVVFALSRKINKIPHKATTCLVVSHFISCLGAILWNTIKVDAHNRSYIQFAFFTIGVYSSRLWTAILAITLLFLQCRSLCFVVKLQPYFMAVGWGVPVLMCATLLIFDKSASLPFERQNPNFAYGASQAVVAVSLLVLCFIGESHSMKTILHQRYRRLYSRYLDVSNEVANPLAEDSPLQPGQSGCSGVGKSPRNGLPTIKEGCCEDKELTSPVDIEDLVPTTSSVNSSNGDCGLKYGCQGPQRAACQAVVGQYRQPIDEDLEAIEEEPESHDPQILRHTVLLILLLCSMFVGLSLSIWTLVMEQISGIYVELSFLDAILNFGQSVLVFVIFGLDVKEVVLPVVKFWRKLWFGANTLTLPAWDELSHETRHVCDQFVTHHLRSCKQAIAADKRWRFTVYHDVFAGKQFIDWLIEVGLARDRVEAVNYGRHLIEGRVLKHINGVYHFYDRSLLYTFV
uniref:DEP domain-containing protein n=1 Tax=Dendroctonus ponderosae TaxID=77166 RepID=A0AAR5Q468_DENPD